MKECQVSVKISNSGVKECQDEVDDGDQGMK